MAIGWSALIKSLRANLVLSMLLIELVVVGVGGLWDGQIYGQ